MTSQSVWYCFPATYFSCWRTENSEMVPNQENTEGDQPVQSHSHAQHPLQPQTCVQKARSIVLVKQDSLRQFPRPIWNVSSTTFQSPELLIQCGFIWKETMQLVSGKVELIACQIPLLWHNSFLILVSLWTIQPNLIFEECSEDIIVGFPQEGT